MVESGDNHSNNFPNLVSRIANLSSEALKDIIECFKELSQCSCKTEKEEIAQTINEILYPEIIGEIKILDSEENTQSEEFTKYKIAMGCRIHKLRNEVGLTQEELAKKSNIPVDHIIEIESGKLSPSHYALQKIANPVGKGNYFD